MKKLSLTKSMVSRGILTATIALTLWVGAPNPAHAQTPLTNSGSHIPMGPINPVFYSNTVSSTFAANTNGTYTGTWSSPAQTDWLGSFTVSGPDPSGFAQGSSSYNFSSLSLGALPTGSLFALGDLDDGSGTENVTFKAYDINHSVITSPWLNSPALYESPALIGGDTPTLSDMPGWDWNITTPFTYTFTGTTVPNNPNIGVMLQNNQNIAFLDITHDNSASVYHILAPTAVPEPSSVALLAAGFGTLFLFMRRRSRTAN